MAAVLAALLLTWLAACAGPWVKSTQAAGGMPDLGNDSQSLRMDASRYPSESYLPGEVVVVLEDATPFNLERLLEDYASLLAEDLEESFRAAEALSRGPAIRLRLRAGVGELEAAERLLSSPLVQAAEPNIIFRASYVPNDTHYNQQWNLSAAYGVRAQEAWDMQRGSAALTLAVIDTGLNYDHPDLSGRRMGGYDYYNGDWDPRDDNGHGTQVAGTACANTDNSLGIAGMDWYARIMPLKALGPEGEGNLESVVNSVYHAANNGADVINMSLTSSAFSQELQDAVEYAHANGCVVVAAAGNEGTSRMNYPAGLTYVIGVGSTDRWGRRSSFSNANSSVDLAAPGEDILAPYLGSDYRKQSGTSEAAPQVSAAALLVMAQYPDSTPDEVWRRLRDSARDLGSPGYDHEYGWGLLNASDALCVPLVEIASPGDYSYPDAGKVTASASSSAGDVKYMELWVDGELEESHQFPTPVGSGTHIFASWDLAQLEEGTHPIAVKAIDSGGLRQGEQSVTVCRNRSQPRPSTDWYLAEGTTAWGFEEYVLVQNPNSSPASVHVAFMKPDGSVQEHDFPMPGSSRLTINVNSLVAPGDVSAHVHADREVVAERAMYWSGKDGGHAALGVTGGCATWYLAEGTTAWGFEEYVLVQNPNSSTAGMIFEFLKPGGERVKAVYSVAPRSRFTLNVADVVAGSDVSLSIRADQPVIVERAMYWPQGTRSRADGHCSTGSLTPACTWYLAEGTTAWGFEEYILLANPSEVLAHATLVFMHTDGSSGSHDVKVPAGARVTVMANQADAERDASVKVISTDQPLVVERAMYWNGKEGGTGALGAISP